MKPERELRLAALLPSQSALMPGAERGSRPVLAREVDVSVTIIKDLGKVVLEQEDHDGTTLKAAVRFILTTVQRTACRPSPD